VQTNFISYLEPFINAFKDAIDESFDLVLVIKKLVQKLKEEKIMKEYVRPRKDEKFVDKDNIVKEVKQVDFNSGINVDARDWGLGTLPNQYVYNKTVTSISSALTESKKSQKLKKQEEKEKKKEEMQ